MKIAKGFAVALALSASAAQAEPITRTTTMTSSPISSRVVVPENARTVYLSGQQAVPDAAGVVPADTEGQTIQIFSRMKAQLEEVGFGMGDVVKLNVFIVGDPKLDGKADRIGFNKAYRTFFGSAEQPNLPVRTTVQVAGIAREGAFIEIEAIAAKMPK